MDIRGAVAEYPDLDLYELARQIKIFLMPYSFVESAHLYHGANKAEYHIIFKVPTVPEGWEKIQEVPQETKSNAERLTDFFKVEKPVEVSTAPQTVAELYAKFYHDIQWPALFNLHLDEVYYREVGPKPLGPSHYDERPLEEWEWSIADGNNKILTGFYPITSPGYKGDVENLGLHNLVQVSEPVLLYGQFNKKVDISEPQSEKDPKSFIQSLSISYECDTEIKIKADAQRSKTYSYKELGFHRNDSKEWGALIRLLQSPDHLYHLGVAHGAGKVRNKSYDANNKILREISKKFVPFLNKTYRLQLPANFKIFERVVNGPRGICRLKFSISNFSTEGSNYDVFSQDELIAEIEKLSMYRASLKTRGDSDDRYLQATDNLYTACKIAGKKGWLTLTRMRSYLNPREEETFPEFPDVYEEEEPLRQDY